MGVSNAFLHLKCLFLRAFKKPILAIKIQLFGHFKCQKCFMLLVLGNWHLNARIWNFIRQHLAFMKLTPDR